MLGFVGLGAMGIRLAGRVLNAGYTLGVYNRTPERARVLVERGAHAYASPADLARDADIVFTMLADDDVVEQMMLGPDGLISAAARAATIVDLSSVHPDTSRRIGAAAMFKDIAVLDAPVSGSTPQAEDGSVVMFVGGDRDTYVQCRPVLDALSRQIFYMGPSGAGTTMKLVVNGLLGTGMQALAEALALGQRAGLDRSALLDVLEQTSILAPGYKRKLQNARSNAYPVQFALRLMWKDFRNVLRLAEEHAVPMPTTAAAQQACAIEQVRGIEEDFSAVIRTMEQLAAVAPVPTKQPAAAPVSAADSRNGARRQSEFARGGV